MKSGSADTESGSLCWSEPGSLFNQVREFLGGRAARDNGHAMRHNRHMTSLVQKAIAEEHHPIVLTAIR
jgi:hypothetical protein